MRHLRAWDTKNKKMVHYIHIAPEYGWLVLSDNDAMAERGRSERGQWILMEGTGLKDSKKREIYEDDLIKITCKEYIEGRGERIDIFVKKVVYENEIAGFMPFNDGFYPDEKYCIIEVIGNIWENPELNPQA